MWNFNIRNPYEFGKSRARIKNFKSCTRISLFFFRVGWGGEGIGRGTGITNITFPDKYV